MELFTFLFLLLGVLFIFIPSAVAVAIVGGKVIDNYIQKKFTAFYSSIDSEAVKIFSCFMSVGMFCLVMAMFCSIFLLIF